MNQSLPFVYLPTKGLPVWIGDQDRQWSAERRRYARTWKGYVSAERAAARHRLVLRGQRLLARHPLKWGNVPT